MKARPQPSARRLDVDEAARLLAAGGLVAFGTETVYGLGADATDAAAVARIFEAKRRPSFDPLIVHLADAGDVGRVTSKWTDRQERLAAAFWPGPLTIVSSRGPAIPPLVTSGLPPGSGLRAHLIESAAHMRLLTMGLVLLLVLRFAPRGLIPEK